MNDDKRVMVELAPMAGAGGSLSPITLLSSRAGGANFSRGCYGDRGHPIPHRRHQPLGIDRRDHRVPARPRHGGPRHRLVVLVAHLRRELADRAQRVQLHGSGQDRNRRRPGRVRLRRLGGAVSHRRAWQRELRRREPAACRSCGSAFPPLRPRTAGRGWHQATAHPLSPADGEWSMQNGLSWGARAMRTAEPLSNEALAMRQLQRADGDGWWTGVLRMRGGEPPPEGA